MAAPEMPANTGMQSLFDSYAEEPELLGMGLVDDFVQALSPWTTGDLGCVALKREGDYYIKDETGATAGQAPPITKKEAEELAAQNLFLAEEKQAKNAPSLVLIDLIQTAIDRREMLLRKMGEEPGLPAGAGPLVSEATAAAQRGTPLGRLALEEYTDQALAREDLESVDLAAARLDMSELLPREASDPEYAATARAAARRSGEAMRPDGAGKPGDMYSCAPHASTPLHPCPCLIRPPRATSIPGSDPSPAALLLRSAAAPLPTAPLRRCFAHRSAPPLLCSPLRSAAAPLFTAPLRRCSPHRLLGEPVRLAVHLRDVRRGAIRV